MRTDLARRRGEEGFTLVELVVVMIVIGFLGVIVARQFTGGLTDSAAGQAMIRVAERVDENWRTFVSTAGVSLDPRNNEALNSESALQALCVDGEDDVASDYVSSWRRASISLIDDIVEDGGSYQYDDYEVIFEEGNGHRELKVEFQGVPERIAEQVAVELEEYSTDGSTDLDGYEGRRSEYESSGGDYNVSLLFN